MLKKNRVCFFLAAAVVLTIIALTGCSKREEKYPDKNKSVTIIVERAAGGGSDLTARAIAPLLKRELGIPVVVVNKTGGDGVVA